MNCKDICAKLVLALIFILIDCNILFAQDAHFSQFDASPNTMNPAHTGNYIGDWRFVNTYRSQWFAIPKPYMTITMAYDHQFYFHNDVLSSGIIFMGDRSGALGLTTNRFCITQAYQKKIGKHVTHLGFQLGYTRRRISAGNFTYPEQFDMSTGYFNSQLPSSEPAMDISASHWDVNTGILWNRNYGRIRPEIGIALYHINYPSVLFGEDFTSTSGAGKSEKEIQIRKVVHGKTECMINERYSLIPCFGYMGQGSANEVIAGAIWKHNIIKENSMEDNKINSILFSLYIRDGHKRNFDALIFGLGMNFRKSALRFSYDCTLSKLSVATSTLGAFELSFIYTAISTRHTNGFVPDFRF